MASLGSNCSMWHFQQGINDDQLRILPLSHSASRLVTRRVFPPSKCNEVVLRRTSR